MINAVNLVLGKNAIQQFVQGFGRLQVTAKRFFNDDPGLFRIGSKFMLGKILGDRSKKARSYSEVVHNVRFRLPFLGQALNSFGLLQIGLVFLNIRNLEIYMRSKSLPFFAVCLPPAGKLVDILEQSSAKLIIRLLGSTQSDDGKILGKPGVQKQIIQRGNQLAGSEVPCSSENKEESWLRLNWVFD